MTVDLRPYGDGDLQAVVGLCNAVSRSLDGRDERSEDEMRTYLSMPAVDPARDLRLAESDGALVGYADVYDQNDWHTRYWTEIRVHPGHEQVETAHLLTAWAEERARSDAGAAAFLRSYVSDRAELMRTALEDRGYRIIRRSFTMLIELDGELPAPEWPDRIQVRAFAPGEERAVYEAHEECFADHWEHVKEPYEEFLHWTVEREKFDPSLWFLAVEDGEIAGYALCEQGDTERDKGWVALLGVRRPWRQRGLGRALLLHAFGEFHRRGFRRASLGVDAESLTGAVRLYERVGMHVERRKDCYHLDL